MNRIPRFSSNSKVRGRGFRLGDRQNNNKRQISLSAPIVALRGDESSKCDAFPTLDGHRTKTRPPRHTTRRPDKKNCRRGKRGKECRTVLRPFGAIVKGIRDVFGVIFG